MEIEKKTVKANFEVWEKYKDFLASVIPNKFFPAETKTSKPYVLWYYYTRLSKFINSDPSKQNINRFNHIFPNQLSSISDLKIHRVLGDDTVSKTEEEVPQETESRDEEENEETKKERLEAERKPMLPGLQPGKSRRAEDSKEPELSKEYLKSGLVPNYLRQNFLNTKWLTKEDLKYGQRRRPPPPPPPPPLPQKQNKLDKAASTPLPLSPIKKKRNKFNSTLTQVGSPASSLKEASTQASSDVKSTLIQTDQPESKNRRVQTLISTIDPKPKDERGNTAGEELRRGLDAAKPLDSFYAAKNKPIAQRPSPEESEPVKKAAESIKKPPTASAALWDLLPSELKDSVETNLTLLSSKKEEKGLLQTYAPGVATIKKEFLSRSRKNRRKREDISEKASKEGEGIAFEHEHEDRNLSKEDAINFAFHYLQHLKHDHYPIYHEANEAFHSSIRKGGAIGNMSAATMAPLFQYPIEYIKGLLQTDPRAYMYTDEQAFGGAPVGGLTYAHDMPFKRPPFYIPRPTAPSPPMYLGTDDEYFNGIKPGVTYGPDRPFKTIPFGITLPRPMDQDSFFLPPKRKRTYIGPQVVPSVVAPKKSRPLPPKPTKFMTDEEFFGDKTPQWSLSDYPDNVDLPKKYTTLGMDASFKHPPLPIDAPPPIRSATDADANDPNISLATVPIETLHTIMAMADRFGLLPGYLQKIYQSGALKGASRYLPAVGYDHKTGSLILPDPRNLFTSAGGIVTDANNRMKLNDFVESTAPGAKGILSRVMDAIPSDWLPVLLNALTAGAGAYYLGAPLFNFGRRLLSARGEGRPTIPAGLSRGLGRFQPQFTLSNPNLLDSFSSLTNEELAARRRIQEMALRNPILNNQIRQDYPGLMEADSPSLPQRLLVPQRPLTPAEKTLKNMLLGKGTFRAYDNQLDTPYVVNPKGMLVDINYLSGVLKGEKRGPVAQKYLEEFRPILKDYNRGDWNKIEEFRDWNVPATYFKNAPWLGIGDDGRRLAEALPKADSSLAPDLVPTGDGIKISHKPYQSHPIHPFQRHLGDIVHEMPIGSYIRSSKSKGNYQYDRDPHIFTGKVFRFQHRPDDYIVRFHRPHITESCQD